ncbi:MAG: guanylate kinase [Bacteroidota bacterium]
MTAPSGAGKTTIARRLLEVIPGLRFSVSATTRPARAHETDGVHYHFVTTERFRELITEGALLEFEEVYHGRFYGTLKTEVEQSTAEAPVLLDIDVKGALRVKNLYQDEALTIFIQPPSLEELARRLSKRGTETPETLKERVQTATRELNYAPSFDHVVVNEVLEIAVEETIELVRSFLHT